MPVSATTPFAELVQARAWQRLQQARTQVRPARDEPLTVLLLSQACEAAGDRRGAERALRQALAVRRKQVVLLHAWQRLWGEVATVRALAQGKP